MIRFIQEARKRAGLEVSDRIRLAVAANPELSEAIEEHRQLITDEVLAVSLELVDELDDVTDSDEELGLTLRVTKA